MPADRTPLPPWRSQEAYRALLAADPSVWAWEFGRRQAVTEAQDPAGGVPGLCFVGEGPGADAVPTVLWRWQADSSVPVLSLTPASVGDPDALDLRGLDLAVIVVRTQDGHQHVMVSDGARRLRFAVADGDVLAGPARCRFHLPAHSVGVASMEGLRLLIALRDTGRLPSMARGARSKSVRWLQMLRAHDARCAGASQRDIAMLIFGEARVHEDWNGRSDYMRMRVQRLLRAAEGLVAGGYRALCGLRPARMDSSKTVDVWRSAAWRGGRAAMLLVSGSFLGTSCELAGCLHGLCRLW
jgi:hypothetical protein